MLLGVVLLTLLDTSSTLASVSGFLVIIGVGMGVMFQVYVIAAQNAVEVTQIGVVTGQLNFFRSMGGSFAVAGLGALLTGRLGVELVKQLGAAGKRIDPNTVVQSGAGHLPPRVADSVATALSNSLHSVWLVCIPLAAIGLALAFALEEQPLRRHNPAAQEQQKEPQEPSLAGSAER